MLLTRPPLSFRRKTVRLACVKHAASVCPEPGSNSPNKNCCEMPLSIPPFTFGGTDLGLPLPIFLSTLQLLRSLFCVAGFNRAKSILANLPGLCQVFRCLFDACLRSNAWAEANKNRPYNRRNPTQTTLPRGYDVCLVGHLRS